jgi:hypothetical protein
MQNVIRLFLGLGVLFQALQDIVAKVISDSPCRRQNELGLGVFQQQTQRFQRFVRKEPAVWVGGRGLGKGQEDAINVQEDDFERLL